MRLPRFGVVGTLCGVALLAGCGGASTAAVPFFLLPTTPRPAPTTVTRTPATPEPTATDAAGEERKSAPEILADARRNFAATSAVHVTGTFALDRGKPITVDLQLQGDDVNGSIRDGKQPLQLVIVGGVDYLRASSAFWTATAGAVAGRLGGHWIILPISVRSRFADFTLRGFDEVFDPSDSPLEPRPTTAVHDGRRVLVLTRQNGDQAFVTDSSTPLLLELTSQHDTADDVRFSGYGAPIPITKPPGAGTAQQIALGGSSA